jgi:hypothetical protein
MSPLQIDPKTVDNLKMLVRNASRSRLKLISKKESIILEEIQGDPKVYAHWMAIILIASRDVRITFKSHYMTPMAKRFAENAYSISTDQITTSQATDFLKEFCNLTAGYIKIALDKASIKAGISLPLVTRGFDEVFFPKVAGHYSIIDQWRLSEHSAIIDCSSVIEIYSEMQLKDISDPDDDHGSVDFL